MSDPDRPDTTTPWLQAAGVPERLLQAIEALGAGVAIKAIDSGQYVQVSASLDRLFERSETSVVGNSDSELMRPDEAQAMRRVELQAMQSATASVNEHRLELGGRRREFSVVRVALGPQHLLAAWQERTQERQREIHLQRALAQIEQHQAEIETLRRELQKGSGRDEATGLQQLGLFNELLEREIDLSTREHREFSLVLVALDVPESLAEAADAQQRLLEALGRLLRSNTRAMDAACRLDGNHFAILLSGVGLATAHARMEQLRRQCAQQIVAFEGRDLGLSVSLGVASFPHTSASHAALLEAAQQALRHAQRRGGNQVGLAAIPLGG
ncbi:MAG: diguanylate cyclase [Inhella sp.]